MKMSTNRRNFFKTVGLATAGLATGLHSDLLGMSLVTDQKKRANRSPGFKRQMIYPTPFKGLSLLITVRL